MNGGPSVIVNKGGFFSSLAKGFFGLLTVTVICVTAVGLYGVRTADQQISRVVSIVNSGVPAVLEVARGWQEALPPALKDALNDRRAFDYCSQVDIRTSMRDVDGASRDDGTVVVMFDVTNRGDQVVSLLGLHLFVEDDGPRTMEKTVYAATPLAIEDEWRGPLLPGQTRRLAQSIHHVDGTPEVKVDVVELRLWNGPAEDHQPVAAVPAPPAALPAPEAPAPAGLVGAERKPSAADNAASPPAAVDVHPQPVAAARSDASDN